MKISLLFSLLVVVHLCIHGVYCQQSNKLQLRYNCAIITKLLANFYFSLILIWGQQHQLV